MAVYVEYFTKFNQLNLMYNYSITVEIFTYLFPTNIIKKGYNFNVHSYVLDIFEIKNRNSGASKALYILAIFFLI